MHFDDVEAVKQQIPWEAEADFHWSSADTRSETLQGGIGLYIKSPHVSANSANVSSKVGPPWMRHQALLETYQPEQSAKEL